MALCGALALVMASMASLTTALPSIGRSTGATQGQLTWIIDAYPIVFAGLLLPCGALGDKYGRRRMLRYGLVVFALASLLGPVLDSPEALIGARGVAGLGAGLVMPATLSLITTTVKDSAQDRAVAVWAAVATIGEVLGIVGAGLLLEVSDWHSILYVSAAVAALLAVAPTRGWGSMAVGFSLLAGLAFLAVFVVIELRAAHPLLDIRIFRLPHLRTGTVALVALFAVLFGFFFLSMKFLQLIQGRSPLGAGLSIIPVAITLLPLSLIAPMVVARFGLRAVTALGLCVTPSTVAILRSAPASKQGVASAINDAAREVGAALGIAVSGSLLATGYAHHLGAATDTLPEPVREAARGSLAGAFGAAAVLGPAAQPALVEAQAAFQSGMHTAFVACAIFTVVCAGAVALFAPGRNVAVSAE